MRRLIGARRVPPTGPRAIIRRAATAAEPAAHAAPEHEAFEAIGETEYVAETASHVSLYRHKPTGAQASLSPPFPSKHAANAYRQYPDPSGGSWLPDRAAP